MAANFKLKLKSTSALKFSKWPLDFNALELVSSSLKFTAIVGPPLEYALLMLSGLKTNKIVTGTNIM
jgi:hypothetical protein